VFHERARISSSDIPFAGDQAAKFASEELHKRLVTEEPYRDRQYEAALKRAFLDTDEDLRGKISGF
jgi:hypothetical protein